MGYFNTIGQILKCCQNLEQKEMVVDPSKDVLHVFTGQGATKLGAVKHWGLLRGLGIEQGQLPNLQEPVIHL